MTEEVWLSNKWSIFEAIDFLEERGLADARKCRLYACACARLLWDALAHKTHRRTVELAEDFADGLIPCAELAAARDVAVQFREQYETSYDQEDICPGRVVFATAAADAASAARDAWYHASNVFGHLPQVPVPRSLRGEVERLLREVFGNPFRPCAVDPAWLAHDGGAVAKLARAAYDERDLPQGTLSRDRLAVLADALEDVGCAEGVLLSHLREPGRHVLGCWAVDQVLDRE
jgi:hypothetical protein